MHIIGIIGPAGSGKDTAASVLTRMHPQIVRRALADELKEDVSKLWKIPIEDCYSKDKPHVRQTLQLWGTEHGRTIDPDYWFLRWAYWVLTEQMKRDIAGVVVPDLRFPNEAQIAHQTLGGYLLFITRSRQFDDKIYDHASENHCQGMRAAYRDEPRVAYIHNDGTKTEFERACGDIFRVWGFHRA